MVSSCKDGKGTEKFYHWTRNWRRRERRRIKEIRGIIKETDRGWRDRGVEEEE